MTVTPDPDLMAARPDLMLAAAADYERVAHQVNSVADTTGRASRSLLVDWRGRGAEGFANQMGRLSVATPDAARALLATAIALRTLASRISEAQALARRSILLDEWSRTVGDDRLSAKPVVEDVSPAQGMMDRANELNRSANMAATAAFNAITATAPSVKAAATLTSAVKDEPVRRPEMSTSQVRLVTQPDGRRVYSFDGGFAIPADLPGAHKFVEELKAYLPRFVAGDVGGIDVAAHPSAREMWFELASVYTITAMGEVPEQIRNLFSTATSSSITFRQVAGYAMVGASDPASPSGAGVLQNDVIDEQIAQANQALGTPVGSGPSGRGAFRAGASGGDGLGALEGVQVTVTPEGLEQVESHLEQFGSYGPNEAMLSRLKDTLASGKPVSGADAAFYTHELAESELMSQGLSYEDAHAAALSKFGVSPYAVYSPEVIARYPEEFGPGWKEFWRISR